MELIPILSLIILVATISTFILAVGAYILYKVRERKGITAQAAQPSAIPAELVAPAPLMQEQRFMTPERRTFEPQAPYYTPQEEQSRGPELKPTFVGSAPTYDQKRTGETLRTSEEERSTKSSKKKYMRYSTEGYEDPTQQERKKEDNLRWR